jgi:acylphosphatase
VDQRPDDLPDGEPQVRLHAVVHGRVQGVSFRYYTSRTAEQLHLSGWVANRWDGTVEATAEGSRTALEQFREFLERGSPGAFVERLDVEWLPAKGEFRSFKVRLI